MNEQNLEDIGFKKYEDGNFLTKIFGGIEQTK